MTTEPTFSDFKRQYNLSMEDLYKKVFAGNRGSIKIKKEGVALKNLSKILDAALRLSNAKGFTAMSLRDLSKETGLSMGALYTYFSSKDELLHIIQDQSRVVINVLSDYAGGIDDPGLKLKRVVQAHLYLSEVMQPLFYFAYMETKNLARDQHKKAIEAELSTEKVIVDVIKEGIGKGVFRQIDTDLAGAVIKSMLQDWYLKRWKYARRRITVEKYATFILDVIETYIASNQQ
jgi:TetR/AcrR family transcriptional regulator, cholesterol catabolism regulator